MKLPFHIPAVVLRRYGRSHATVRLDNGEVMTVKLPSLSGAGALLTTGCSCSVTEHLASRSRHRYKISLVKTSRVTVCVDGMLANELVFDHVKTGRLPELAGFSEYRRAVQFGSGGVSDICCTVYPDNMLRRCWVKLYPTALVEDGVAAWPDTAVSGAREHLDAMRAALKDEDEACVIFTAMRSDVQSFSLLHSVNREVAAALRKAARAGVKVIALSAGLTKTGIRVVKRLAVEL